MNKCSESLAEAFVTFALITFLLVMNWLKKVKNHLNRRAYQRARNVCFLENLACFVFLKHPFWDSPFCFITDEIRDIAQNRSFVKDLLSDCEQVSTKLRISQFLITKQESSWKIYMQFFLLVFIISLYGLKNMKILQNILPRNLFVFFCSNFIGNSLHLPNYPKVQNLFFQWDRLMLFVVTGPVQLALFELCFDFSFTWIMFYYIIDYLCYMSGVQQET